jgi:hypothetical protein
VATDHADYGSAIRSLLDAPHAGFELAPWPAEEAERTTTNYALKWRRAGRALWWACYRRTAR